LGSEPPTVLHALNAKAYFAEGSHAVQFSLLKVKELIEKSEIKF